MIAPVREPAPGATPIVWAVYLGANTHRRLATQWNTGRDTAKSLLNNAVKAGDLILLGHHPNPDGGWPVPVYGIPTKAPHA